MADFGLFSQYDAFTHTSIFIRCVCSINPQEERKPRLWNRTTSDNKTHGFCCFCLSALAFYSQHTYEHPTQNHKSGLAVLRGPSPATFKLGGDKIEASHPERVVLNLGSSPATVVLPFVW